MNRLIKLALSTLLLLAASYQSRASHQAGHDLTYVYVGDSAGLQHYRVTLTIIQDCLNGSPGAIADDNPAFIGIFNGSTRILLDSTAFFFVSVPLPVTMSGPCDSGLTTISGCTLKKIFTRDYYLPPSTAGYTISYQRCCMNAGITNITDPSDFGTTATCTIPPYGTATHNNSAVFTNYPPYVIANYFPLVFDCSASDADGDSLSYTLCNAITGADDPNNAKPFPAGPPYTYFSYVAPMSYSNPISASVPFVLNPVTGQMTGTPNTEGRYLVDVCCSEWRGGVLINTTQREFEMVVLNCRASLHEVVQLFPNPSINKITVSSTNIITSLTVINAVGQRIDVPWNFTVSPTGKLDGQDATADISLMAPGVYFVKVNDGDAQKFIKQW